MKDVRVENLLKEYQGLPEYSGKLLVDVNQPSLFGDRPIHVASTRGAIEEMEALVACGAQINSPGEHGYTALHNAVEQGHIEAATWLIKHGATQSLRNDDGLTPLMLACVLGDDVMQTLLRSLGEI